MIQALIRTYFTARQSAIGRFMDDPLSAQNNILTQHIIESRETEIGEKYRFSDIEQIADFSQAIPLQDYETLKPSIQKMLDGAENVLWPYKVHWFAKSSGTTNDVSKYIPVSYEAMKTCHYRGARDVFALYFKQFPESEIFKGRGIIMGGSHQVNSYNNEMRFGDLSAVLIENMPSIGKFFSALSSDTALIGDWEIKMEAIIKETLDQDISNISGVPTWTLVLFKKLLERTGRKYIDDLWPNFELYIHGGVSFVPYHSQFKKLCSPKVNFWETYNASEGFFALQDDATRDDLLLMLDYGIYYEFIPSTEWDNKEPKAIPLIEVNLQERYAVVITTNSGLWRYQLGDVVRFTSIMPYRIKITGRTKHFINVFGEELMVDNTDKALNILSEKYNLEVVDYTAAPIYMEAGSKGGHEWIIEFAMPPNNTQEFAQELDSLLQSINSDYAAKRHKDIALQSLIVHIAPPGSFHQWMKSRGKLGGQNKVPRLSNDRKHLDALLAIIQSQ